MINKIKKYPETIKIKKPVISHITNYVTANDCANITLAAGASPVMADEISEIEEIINFSSATVINIGTLNQYTAKTMLVGGKRANQKNIPVVLDPAGVGISKFRSNFIAKFLNEVRVSAVKGNLSELFFLAGENSKMISMDALDKDNMKSSKYIQDVAVKLSLDLKCTVAVTGKVDIITDGRKFLYIKNGHKMLSEITGTGCMSSSLIASYCSISKDVFSGVTAGLLFMGIAGEKAFELAGNSGSGSFRAALIDEIYNMKEDTIFQKAEIYEK